MAKARPLPTLTQMESKLGFKVDSLTYPDEISKRFYSDLRPIPRSIYGKTREEFEECEKKAHRSNEKTISEKVFAEVDVVKVGRLEPSIRHTDTSIDNRRWRRHCKTRVQESYCILQFHSGYPPRLRIRLATAIH